GALWARREQADGDGAERGAGREALEGAARVRQAAAHLRQGGLRAAGAAPGPTRRDEVARVRRRIAAGASLRAAELRFQARQEIVEALVGAREVRFEASFLHGGVIRPSGD